MTSRIGMQASNKGSSTQAFSLVELILVMALLATVMAFSAPSLSRSLRQRHLDQEAARFVALTEYARNEAVSQGLPMVVWIDPKTGRFGSTAKSGSNGEELRSREYAVNQDIHFDLVQTAASNGVVDAVEFAPDGAPDPSSIETLQLVDRFESVITVALTEDGWGYEILKEQK